jgi:L-2-hydroxyglutarate oxidase LhgO
LVPSLKYSYISRYPLVGIRAQLFDRTKNELVMDYLILKGDNSIHILNAVSPAFTSSLAFAKYVVGDIKDSFHSLNLSRETVV